MDITITLTSEQVKAIKPIIDIHGEVNPDRADITDWVYSLITTEIDKSVGYY